MSPSHQRNQTGRSHRPRPESTFISPSIPTAQQVLASVCVSIVLKQDQATGHQVQGSVGEVLTRGNHPRGIKVRLRDGRVGRVQRIVSASEVSEEIASSSQPTFWSYPSGRSNVNADIRLDASVYADTDADRHEASLGDFVVVKKKRKSKSTVADNHVTSAHAGGTENTRIGVVLDNITVVTCPVCENFQGDEVAVSYHVNNHFS